MQTAGTGGPFGFGCGRAVSARATLDPKRFIDVQYQELVRDPIATVRKVYEYFAFPFSAEFEERMRAWMTTNQQHRFGKHGYDLAQCGLEADRIHRELATYRERFSVPIEG